LAVLVATPLCWAGGNRQSAAHAKLAAQAEEGPPNKGLGSRNAPIVMEVFSDYSCPACRGFYISAIRPLLDDYVATGKVYLIHRDFPLKGVIGHEHSREAALYANAAAEIGKFQEVDAALYDKQPTWTKDGSVDATVASVLTPADMKHVRKLLENGKLQSYIDSDQALGTQKGVRQTPSIYVTAHGTTYPLPAGGVSYNLLRKFLDEQLRP
jgi:protein-disulfide isomerase